MTRVLDSEQNRAKQSKTEQDIKNGRRRGGQSGPGAEEQGSQARARATQLLHRLEGTSTPMMIIFLVLAGLPGLSGRSGLPCSLHLAYS